MDWATTIIVAIMWSCAIATVVVISLWHNPRLWLHDVPAVISEAVPPKTITEKRWSVFYGALTSPILIGVPVTYALVNSQAQLGEIWLHLFAMALIFNIVDLLFIDWLLVCAITPRWVIIPGTEAVPAFNGYKDYRFFAQGFVKGLGFCLVLPTIIVGVVAIKF